MITDVLVAQPAPCRMDDDGVLRVAGTRVRLDTIVSAFNSGYAPEEILLKYPSLNLTDIYAVITYYLWHREELDQYLVDRQEIVEQVRQENERRFPPQGIRQRLLARQIKSP
ncbi:MAG: DUF433 domain-containing protein [Chloroflexi bacterium]|nr:DUF433 domain-containing protein [Chloroflexota bacterium]